MELFNYFRSSASYRVRIALALKGLPFDYRPVHLARNEQTAESYACVSASRLVPLLRDHFDVRDIPVYAVMLPERHRLPKIRACVDYWAGCLGQAPFRHCNQS